MKYSIEKIKKVFRSLGPGFITGAADDDPSGIATYSIAGAQFGYRMNWMSLFLIPMMISIQEMCARIGLASGYGLAGVMKKYYSKSLLYCCVSLLMIANIINIAADLGVMAASVQMLTGTSFLFWLAIITVGTTLMQIIIPYKKYVIFLRVMGLTLLVYLATMILARQNWNEVLFYTLYPHIEFSPAYLLTMIGFAGTTISPYLFFWQTSEEVEEEIADGTIKDFHQHPHIFERQIKKMRRDTNIGMIFAQIITMAIVLTTAATLHEQDITHIETPHQIADALRPLAGDWAYVLFAVGIIGIGLQAVPVLTGGLAYAFAETFGFKEGLNKPPQKAKAFYAIIAISTVIGALMNMIGINPVQALYYSSIINGIISVPLIFVIIKLSDDPRVIGHFKTPKVHRLIAWITFLFVGLSSVLLIYNLLPK